MYRWMRLFSARRTHLLYISTILRSILYELFKFTNYSDKDEPQCQATPIEFGSPHESICAGFVDICLPVFHSY
jgi:hypothetical protein